MALASASTFSGVGHEVPERGEGVLPEGIEVWASLLPMFSVGGSLSYNGLDPTVFVSTAMLSDRCDH